MLVAGHPECVTLVQFILHCTAHPDKKIAELTYELWFSLQNALQTEEQQKTYRPIFAQLVSVLIKQLEYPEEFIDIGLHITAASLHCY